MFVRYSPDGARPAYARSYALSNSIIFQGGVSIAYTDVRFKGETREGPGPTEYTLPDDLFKETPRETRSHPGTWRGPAGKVKYFLHIHLSRIDLQRILALTRVSARLSIYAFTRINEHLRR